MKKTYKTRKIEELLEKLGKEHSSAYFGWDAAGDNYGWIEFNHLTGNDSFIARNFDDALCFLYDNISYEQECDERNSSSEDEYRKKENDRLQIKEYALLQKGMTEEEIKEWAKAHCLDDEFVNYEYLMYYLNS